MELAESKQCVVGIILPKWPGHFGSSFVSTDFGKFEVRSLTLAFTLCFSAMAPKSFAAAGMDDVMEVDVPPSTLDSEMLSEGSFQLVDQLIEITTEDYQMAEQVAETHKNEEDAASLTLSGAPLDDHAMLQNTTKVDLQKFLAELTAAMQQLATKDQPVDQGASTQPGPAGDPARCRTVTFSKSTRTLRRSLPVSWPAHQLAARSFLWSRAISGTCSETSPWATFGTFCPSLATLRPSLRPLSTGSLRAMDWRSRSGSTKRSFRRRTSTPRRSTTWRQALRSQVSSCTSPWHKQQSEGKCLACGKIGSRMHKMKDMGMTQEVDGATWRLMITDKGVTWKIQPKEGETPDEEQEANMKAAASINVADFSIPLKQPQINTEVSYSDLVPNNQRVLLRNQVNHPVCQVYGRWSN